MLMTSTDIKVVLQDQLCNRDDDAKSQYCGEDDLGAAESVIHLPGLESSFFSERNLGVVICQAENVRIF